MQSTTIVPNLFSFCHRGYWQNLDSTQLLNWNHAVAWYLSSLDDSHTQRWGLAAILGDCEVDLTNSGRCYEDFDGKHFPEKSLYRFLYWVGQRLVGIVGSERTLISFYLQLTPDEGSNYLDVCEMLLRDPRKVIGDFREQWLRVVNEVGRPDASPLSKVWLLAKNQGSKNRDDFDKTNLEFAQKWGAPWNNLPLGRNYWILDRQIAEWLLQRGIKGYGIDFVNNFDLSKVDEKFQELLLGSVVY